MKKLSLFLALVLLLGLTASCGGSGNNSGGSTASTSSAASTSQTADTSDASESTGDSENPWAHLDTSEHANIVMYMVSSRPDAMDEIMVLANQRLEELINTSVEVIHIPSADRFTKYPLLMAGGDDVDLIYTSLWCFFTDQASKGGFMELTDEFLQTNMPETWKIQEPVAWVNGSYKGTTYAIPRSTNPLYGVRATLVNKEIREKYELPVVDSYENLDLFLRTVADKESANGMFAFNQDISRSLQALMLEQPEGWSLISDDFYWDSDDNLEKTEDSIKYIYDSEEYLEYILLMAEYAKLNVWPANAINNTATSRDQFQEGKSAFAVGNYYNDDKIIKSMRDKGYEVEFNHIFHDDAVLLADIYNGDMFAIPIFCQQPERAAIALDVMKTDFELNMLLTAGVEGRHYIYYPEDGTYDVGPEQAAYGFDFWSWGLRAPFFPSPRNREESIQKAAQELDDHRMPDDVWPFQGFYFDRTNVTAEYAAISSLVSEYKDSFNFGIFGDDTEKNYREFVNKLKASGLDKVVDEFKRQAMEHDVSAAIAKYESLK